jgi:hypothetical protein
VLLVEGKLKWKNLKLKKLRKRKKPPQLRLKLKYFD